MRRPIRVVIRYHTAEAATVRERARICGAPLARYVRQVSLGALPRERRHRATDELIRHLARIGNNLNQLAREANARDRFPMEARIDAAVDELRRAIVHLARDDDGELDA
jgi:hypothetical protein